MFTVGGASTARSLSVASMVEVVSGLACSSFEAGLDRYGVGELGGEMNITSGSVETTGLAGPEGCKSASRFEKIAKMLS